MVDQIVRSELPYKDDEKEGGYRIAGAHPFINRAKRKEDNSAYFSDLWREILLLSMHLGKMSLSFYDDHVIDESRFRVLCFGRWSEVVPTAILLYCDRVASGSTMPMRVLGLYWSYGPIQTETDRYFIFQYWTDQYGRTVIDIRPPTLWSCFPSSPPVSFCFSLSP